MSAQLLNMPDLGDQGLPDSGITIKPIKILTKFAVILSFDTSKVLSLAPPLC
jgi:hypothetical protein